MIPDFTGRKMLAIDVFSAGIRYLKEHLFTHFQTRIEHLRESDIHWVLTVPAIWDETAKKFMRTSAEQVGIVKLYYYGRCVSRIIIKEINTKTKNGKMKTDQFRRIYRFNAIKRIFNM